MAYGLLLLRVVVGATMFAHGSQKIFGWWGGGGPRGTANFFGSVGWRAPLVQATLAGLSECAGVLLALGFLTPFASLAIAVVMVTAVATVHWPNGFFNMKGGFEFNLTLWTVAVALAATGPGRFSLDRALHWNDNLSGLWWGVGVAGASVVLAFVNMAVFRHRHRITEAAAA
jgi:putative oxidoreductase